MQALIWDLKCLLSMLVHAEKCEGVNSGNPKGKGELGNEKGGVNKKGV